MRYVLMFLSLLTPYQVLAALSLTPVADAPYQKSIYKLSSDKGIQGGSPVPHQSFHLVNEGKVLGSFIAGQGFDSQDKDVCFVAWSNNAHQVERVLPTIGFGDWEAETCHATRSVGMLDEKDNKVIIAVIYDVASPNTTAQEAIIVSVDLTNHSITINEPLTRKIGASGAKSIKELRTLYRTMP